MQVIHNIVKWVKRLKMGYIIALFKYLQTEKARLDIIDYFRAIMIIAAVIAGIMAAVSAIRDSF